MKNRHRIGNLCVGAAALALAACGGGGGGAGVGNVVSTPAPVTPQPPQTTNGTMFAAEPTQPLVSASTAEPTPFDIRYDAATKTYEVSSDGATWKTLTTFNDTPSPTSFPFDGGSLNVSERYTFSAMGYIQDQTNSDRIAFGVSTPAGAVPLAGSATYQGSLIGKTDIAIPGAGFNEWIEGSIQLAFDFGAGTLGGSIRPTLFSSDGWDAIMVKAYDPIALVDTAFGAGSTSFSGRFDIAGAGTNAFSGHFTGPAAEELIGKWAFPLIPPAGTAGAGELHSAWGVMIGKR